LVGDADVVHVHQPLSRTGTIAILAAKQNHRRIAVTDTGFDNSNSLLNKWAGMTLVDRIICISEFSASFFRPYAKALPIDVVPGPVESEFFTPSTVPIQKIHQILCVARILPHKGVDLIIKALPRGLDLVVCGRIYNSEYYEHLKSLAVHKSVRFITDADDKQVRTLYKSSLVTVLASQHIDCYGTHYAKPELMGLTLLESMAVGTPVLCSRVGAMPELIADAQTGLVFDNLENLSAILRLVDVGEWPPAHASLACVEHVRTNFSLPVVGRKLASIYLEIARHDLQ
jgi:glycosyltransferase involved in cell wall biosynthesis